MSATFPIPEIVLPTLTGINMRNLRTTLCGKDKLPPDFTFEGPAVIRLRQSGNEFIAMVKVVATTPPKPGYLGRLKKSSAHRIFIKWQDRWVPAGRTQQVKAPVGSTAGTDNYYGFKVSRGNRAVTVWVFRKSSKKLVGIAKRTCAPKLSQEERRRELSEFLTSFGLDLN